MTTDAKAPAGQPPGRQQVEQTLFVRKASGLVRGWSSTDGFRYSFLTVNMFLGTVAISYCSFIPGGSIFWGIILTAALVLLEVLVYAALVSAMPRAGGDYVWQTRVFNSPLGFILAITGWWFILWQWAPIYASTVTTNFVQPILRILGAESAAAWFATSNGVFVSCVLLIIFVSYLIALGMKGYARFQKWAMFIGLAGMFICFVLLLINSKADFVTALNHAGQKYYGVVDTYGATLKAGGAGQPSSPFAGSFWQTVRLMPFLCFWLLWPNWGATLYGEVSGAREFRKNIYAMGGGLLGGAALGLILILLAAKTMGYRFFMASNMAWWSGTSPLNGEYMSPFAMMSWLVDNRAVQVILIALVSMICLAFVGTVFLSSTRVVFAAAFDRILPEKAAVVTRGGVPLGAMLLLSLPAIVVSAFYAYTSWYATLTLDATLVIVVTFLGSGLVLTIIKWRRPGIWEQSPVPKAAIGGIPWLSVAAAAYSAFLVVNLVLWLVDPVYGSNNWKSLVYMGILYLVAASIWIISYVLRRRQGFQLDVVARQIPVE
jgi:basic amino acid/polyamine antiporter, APA family